MVEEAEVARPHPHRVGEVGVRGRGGEVGAGGVAEVPEPLDRRATASRPARPRGRRTRRSRRPRRGRRCAGVTSRGPASKVSETSSSSSQPTIDRRPDHSRAPPPSSQKQRGVRGRDLGEERRSTSPSASPRKLATSSAPCSLRTDSGWNCTPSRGSVRWRTAITRAVVAVSAHLEHVGHRQGGQRVVAHGREALRHAREHAAPVVGHRGQVAVRGHDAVDHPAVRRHQTLHAETDAEHGHRPGEQHLTAHREVGRVGRRARARARARRARSPARVRPTCRRAAPRSGSSPVTAATRCTRFHV